MRHRCLYWRFVRHLTFIPYTYPPGFLRVGRGNDNQRGLVRHLKCTVPWDILSCIGVNVIEIELIYDNWGRRFAMGVCQTHTFRASVEVVSPSLIIKVSITLYRALRSLFYFWVNFNFQNILQFWWVLRHGTLYNGLSVKLSSFQSSMGLLIFIWLGKRSGGI
jgi:hypothetical protein